MIMTKGYVKSYFFLAVLLLVGCADVALDSKKRSEHFSPLLSADDIQQIKSLVAARPDIRRPVLEITTEEHRADRATVYTGHWLNVGDESDYFQVEKRNGVWKITSPISHDRLKRIITVS
jgi:hypothetical protein